MPDSQSPWFKNKYSKRAILHLFPEIEKSCRQKKNCRNFESISYHARWSHKRTQRRPVSFEPRPRELAWDYMKSPINTHADNKRQWDSQMPDVAAGLQQHMYTHQLGCVDGIRLSRPRYFGSLGARWNEPREREHERVLYQESDILTCRFSPRRPSLRACLNIIWLNFPRYIKSLSFLCRAPGNLVENVNFISARCWRKILVTMQLDYSRLIKRELRDLCILIIAPCILSFAIYERMKFPNVQSPLVKQAGNGSKKIKMDKRSSRATVIEQDIIELPRITWSSLL